MYRLQTIIILSLLPIATLVFLGLMTLPWFNTGLDWFGKFGTVYFWIVFVALILKGLRKPKWKIIRTIWPYEHGWGTFCEKTQAIMDTGLPKDLAELRCAILNTQENER